MNTSTIYAKLAELRDLIAAEAPTYKYINAVVSADGTISFTLTTADESGHETRESYSKTV